MYGICVRIQIEFDIFNLLLSYVFFVNIETALWLRRVCYDRLQKGRTLGVFVLSALWVRKEGFENDH